MKFIIILICTSLIISPNPWDFKNHGNDWVKLGYNLCDYPNTSPINITTSNVQQLENDYFYFAEMNTNNIGKIQLEDLDNNLVLNFTNPIGIVYYNLEHDDFSNAAQKLYYSFNCSKIYLKLPGEHIIDNKKYDMELQIYCFGPIDRYNFRKTFVSYPVSISDDQDSIFDVFEKIKINDDIKINSFDEFINPFNMFNRIFYYSGSVNFPDCDSPANWIFVENVLKIKKATWDTIFSLLDKEKNIDGNYRITSEPLLPVYILENKFKN